MPSEDEKGPHPDRPCARGCYECLLTYGNQLHHGVINRGLVTALLLRLASAEATSERRGETTTDQHQRLVVAASAAATTGEAPQLTSVEAEFLTWLRERGLRLPDEAGITVPEADARPDFVYRMPGVNLAVFLGGADAEEDAARDEGAEERLYLARWDVIRFPEGSDWDAIAAEHARYFGLGPSS